MWSALGLSLMTIGIALLLGVLVVLIVAENRRVNARLDLHQTLVEGLSRCRAYRKGE